MHVPAEVLFSTQLLNAESRFILLTCISYVSLFPLEGEYVLFILLSLFSCIIFKYDRTIIIATLLYLNINIAAPLLASCMLLQTEEIKQLWFS